MIILFFLSLFRNIMQIDDSGYISLLDVNSSGVNSIPLATPYTPRDFPLDSSNTILSGIDWGAVVAPYWYDVDTSNSVSGRIYYKDVTRDTGADLIGEIDNLATSHLTVCGFATTWALIVTWDHVGYYNTLSNDVSSDGNGQHAGSYVHTCAVFVCIEARLE